MRVDEAKTFNPGLLRHQITYQRKVVSTQNDYGEDVYAWQDVVTLKAQVKAVTGRETQSADQRWAESKYQVKHHYYAGIQQTDRIAWWIDGETRYLDIVDIQDQAGTGRVHLILAKEWAE